MQKFEYDGPICETWITLEAVLNQRGKNSLQILANSKFLPVLESYYMSLHAKRETKLEKKSHMKTFVCSGLNRIRCFLYKSSAPTRAHVAVMVSYRNKVPPNGQGVVRWQGW